MTRHAREALALAVATVIGELTIVILMTSDWSAFVAVAVTLLFLSGPPMFLAVAVWRRRTHPRRTRVLFVVTVVCAVGGLVILGFDLYRYYSDAAFRLRPNMRPIIVPLVQWGVVLAVWVWLVVQEAREKRAKQQTTPPQSS